MNNRKGPPPFSLAHSKITPQHDKKQKIMHLDTENAQGQGRVYNDMFSFLPHEPSSLKIRQLQGDLAEKVKALKDSQKRISEMAADIKTLEEEVCDLKNAHRLKPLIKEEDVGTAETNASILEERVKVLTTALAFAQESLSQTKKESQRVLEAKSHDAERAAVEALAAKRDADEALKAKKTAEDELSRVKTLYSEQRAKANHALTKAEGSKDIIAKAKRDAANYKAALTDAEKKVRRAKEAAARAQEAATEHQEMYETSKQEASAAKKNLKAEHKRRKDAKVLAENLKKELDQQQLLHKQTLHTKEEDLQRMIKAREAAEKSAEDAKEAEMKRRKRIEEMTTEMNSLKEDLNLLIEHQQGTIYMVDMVKSIPVDHCQELVKVEVRKTQAALADKELMTAERDRYLEDLILARERIKALHKAEPMALKLAADWEESQ